MSMFEYQEVSDGATSLAVAERIALSFDDNAMTTIAKEANREIVATTSTIPRAFNRLLDIVSTIGQRPT